MEDRLNVGDKLYVANLPMYMSYLVVNPYMDYEVWYVHKVTPQGYWITGYKSLPKMTHKELKYYGYIKWIYYTNRKHSPTKEGAVRNLHARTKNYVKHCQRRLKCAERKLRHLDEETWEEMEVLASL